jgi:hypothetical protein
MTSRLTRGEWLVLLPPNRATGPAATWRLTQVVAERTLPLVGDACLRTMIADALAVELPVPIPAANSVLSQARSIVSRAVDTAPCPGNETWDAWAVTRCAAVAICCALVNNVADCGGTAQSLLGERTAIELILRGAGAPPAVAQVLADEVGTVGMPVERAVLVAQTLQLLDDVPEWLVRYVTTRVHNRQLLPSQNSLSALVDANTVTPFTTNEAEILTTLLNDGVAVESAICATRTLAN